MSFSSLLSGYAKSKSVPVVEMKKEPIAPKPHPLKEVLTNIRSRTTPVQGFLGSDQSIQRNLGILVTIIDDFPNELLWRMWLDNANADNTFEESPSVRMWFHAKCPEKVRSPWVRERLIRSAHFKPEWGSIEITKAMAHMLHEALFDAPHINKFCFASESCIPIRSLSETLDIIYSSNTTTVNNDVNSSWLNYSHIPNNGYAKQLQHDPLSRALPDGCVYKASQWVMLSRAHAVAVIDLMQQVGQRVPSPNNFNASGSAPPAELPALSNALFSAFQLVGKASDEMFFPSCLAVVGAIEPFDVEGKDSNTRSTTLDATTNCTGSVYKQQITYCDWTDNAKSPQEYVSFPTALITALTQYKHYSTTAKNKKTLETLHIQLEQQYACFLRKIKFPMDRAEVKTGDFNESQLTFLADWLPFIVEKVVTSSACDVATAASTAISSDSTTTDTTVNAPTDVITASTTHDASSASIAYMQHAQDLYSQITSYPIPERVIKKRPLTEEHNDSYSRTNSYSNNDRDDRYSGGYNSGRYDRDSGYNSGHSDRQGRSYDRSYSYDNEYGNGYNNQSSGRDRQDNDSYDRYSSSNDRRKDYRDNYANKSSRYY